MNKAALVEALAVHFDGNKAEAARALKAVIDTVTEQVAKGEKVALTGFGVFERIDRPARMVRNPRTGERKKVKATKIPKFRAGSELKAYVSGERKFAKPAKKIAAKATPAKTATVKTPAVKSTAKTTAKAPAKTTAAKVPANTAVKTAAKAPTTKTTAKAPAKTAKASAKTTAKKVSTTKTAAK